MSDYSELLEVADAAVDVARRIIEDMPIGAVTAKGDRDMATEVDYAVEHAVRTFLAQETPHVGFLGEEEGQAGDARPLMWALDPIDGTANFVRGLPLCGVSLALLDQGKPAAGVIDLPYLNTRYSAAQGHGARANSDLIYASQADSLNAAIVSIGDYAVGADAEEKNSRRLELTSRLAASVQRVRMFGSAAIDLAWVAQGRIDACLMLSNNPWDVAAGVVIAREAGALVVDVDGSEHRADSSATIAVAPQLISSLIEMIQ